MLIPGAGVLRKRKHGRSGRRQLGIGVPDLESTTSSSFIDVEPTLPALESTTSIIGDIGPGSTVFPDLSNTLTEENTALIPPLTSISISSLIVGDSSISPTTDSTPQQSFSTLSPLVNGPTSSLVNISSTATSTNTDTDTAGPIIQLEIPTSTSTPSLICKWSSCLSSFVY
ncbi:hypothetical protein BCR39DRAFT_6421 [Naematelia encephala]|uniref:Uncharacterized protein n=1 Tax=Naematelia encephala TaxID=71784 RepID=A0A1Y2BKW8_9TREE|nr:hypothetical protein BCR39DRAFT_6421 [Naematelia encephala]